MFDVWYAPAVLNLGVETRVRRFENSNHKIIRIAESNLKIKKNIFNFKFNILILDKILKKYHEFNETHSMRYFSTDEIQNFANQTGFSLIESKPFLKNGELSDTTWGSFFILKKIK